MSINYSKLPSTWIMINDCGVNCVYVVNIVINCYKIFLIFLSVSFCLTSVEFLWFAFYIFLISHSSNLTWYTKLLHLMYTCICTLFFIWFRINFIVCILIQIGHTDDYSMMLQNLVEKHPNTKIVCIGYSLGGNLVTKYLGERGSNKLPNIIGGISVCQGYNALE